MKLSIIIVSYNVKDYVKQCIRSIYNSTLDSSSYEIIVVDNDSHDGTVRELKKSFPKLIIKKNSKNLGFSKAVNIGIALAKGDFISIINPDIILGKETFAKLIDYLNHNNKTGCIGPRILNSDGSIQHSCKRSLPTPISALWRLLGIDKVFPKSKFFGKYNLTYLDINKTHKVDAISGAFMLIKRKVVKEVGLFDERFFMFGEDLDYCYRINQKKYDIIYNPSTEIVHYKGESVKQAPYNMVNIFYSAMLIYFDKYSSNHRYWSFFSFFIKVGLKIHRSAAFIQLLLSKVYSLILDSISILISFSFSIYFWYSFNYSQNITVSDISYHGLLIINFLISWYVASIITRIYRRNHFTQSLLFLTLVITFLVSSTTTYFISYFAYSRAVLLLATFLSSFPIIGWRVIIKIFANRNVKSFGSLKNFFDRRILIIGADKETVKVGDKIGSNPYNNIKLIGFIDTENFSHIDTFLGKIEYLDDIVINNNINEIIIREGYYDSSKMFSLIKLLNKLNLSLKIIPKGDDIILGKGTIEEINGIDLLSYKVSFLERNNILIKRIFDLFFSMLLISLSIPIQIICLALNGISKKTIWGLGDHKFDIYYFKTKFKFIRMIPLLYSILFGRTSFVGSEILDSDETNPNNILKPGMTGIYKLNKNNNKYDYFYLENYSLLLDIEIIFKTLRI